MFMLLSLSRLMVGRRHSSNRFHVIPRRRPVISESLPRDSTLFSVPRHESSPVALYVRCSTALGFTLLIASHVCWATCLLGVSIPRLHSSKSPVVFRLVSQASGLILSPDKPSVFRSATLPLGFIGGTGRPYVFRSGTVGIGCRATDAAPSVFRLVKLVVGFTGFFDKPYVLSHAVPNLFQLALLDALLDSLALADQRSQCPAQISVKSMPFRSLFL